MSTIAIQALCHQRLPIRPEENLQFACQALDSLKFGGHKGSTLKSSFNTTVCK